MTDDGETKSMDSLQVAASQLPSSNEVSNAILKLDNSEPEKYLVTWAGEDMDYNCAYNITEIAFAKGGSPRLKLKREPDGGEYIIDSNPTGNPKVWRTSSYSKEERLRELVIYDTEFKWRHWIKQRLGI
jgi:hypothetical protein